MQLLSIKCKVKRKTLFNCFHWSKPCIYLIAEPIAKKIWSIQARNFGSYVTIRPPVHPFIRPSTPQWNQGKISHFLPSVGACNVILHIHVVFNRVPKCDVIENEICEIMGFVKISWKNNVQDAYLPKISNLGQIVSEILAQLCSDDSIQILLKLTWFLILWTKPNLEGFVWNRHSITGLISQRQFAPNC